MSIGVSHTILRVTRSVFTFGSCIGVHECGRSEFEPAQRRILGGGPEHARPSRIPRLGAVYLRMGTGKRTNPDSPCGASTKRFEEWLCAASYSRGRMGKGCPVRGTPALCGNTDRAFGTRIRVFERLHPGIWAQRTRSPPPSGDSRRGLHRSCCDSRYRSSVSRRMTDTRPEAASIVWSVSGPSPSSRSRSSMGI